MTRAERLEQQKAAARAKIDADKARLAHIEAVQREDARKALQRRYFAVGKLAEHAGLFGWDDATLARLFAVLGRLAEIPSPEAVLESLIEEPPSVPVTPNGTHRREKVSVDEREA